MALGFARLHGATQACMELHKVAWSYKLLHGLHKCKFTWDYYMSYMKLHKVTWSYRRPHIVTLDYMHMVIYKTIKEYIWGYTGVHL